MYDADQSVDQRIRFRIGINIGDVIPEGTNLHGDGANIAARLEAVSPVGGICVSRTVVDHVHSRLDLSFEFIGPLTLKNIAWPVEAFVLRLDPNCRGDPTFPTHRSAGCRAVRRGAVHHAMAVPRRVAIRQSRRQRRGSHCRRHHRGPDHRHLTHNLGFWSSTATRRSPTEASQSTSSASVRNLACATQWKAGCARSAAHCVSMSNLLRRKRACTSGRTASILGV